MKHYSHINLNYTESTLAGPFGLFRMQKVGYGISAKVLLFIQFYRDPHLNIIRVLQFSQLWQLSIQ
jgi:hypothetical protein